MITSVYYYKEERNSDFILQMETYGTIERIHFNGLISYNGIETRADGVPVTMLGEEAEGEGNNSESGDEEEEIVLGKGFDQRRWQQVYW
jgi:hypothetical protein